MRNSSLFPPDDMFPPGAPWDDMPDVGRSEPDFSGLSLRQRIRQHFPLAIAFLIGTLVGQTLLFLYVWWLLLELNSGH